MGIYYESDSGYCYEIKKGSTKRVPKKEVKSGYNFNDLKKGVKVEIIVKPYKNGKKVVGIIKRVLTKKKVHTRGHKVMLEDGTVGRMIRIFK